MSNSPRTPTVGKPSKRGTENPSVVDSEEQAEELLVALHDDDCQAILDATSTEALSANELSEACDLPLSTTYRKLETMTEVGFLEERTRIGRAGKHASEYVRIVEDVTVSITEDGSMELEVSRREQTDSTSASIVGTAD